MTTDVIALTTRMPDVWSLAAGLMAGGPDTRVSDGADGAVICLSDAQGRPLASIEAPVLVRTPGEAARLLGPEGAVAGTGPLWWTEVRAATGTHGGERLAGTIATRLVARLGGVVWPSRAAVDAYGETAADVVAAAGPGTGSPAIDVLTGKAAVIIQDRPVVAMTTWLADAVRMAAEGDRAVQIVTPPGARLTLPVRATLSGLPHRWVVQDGAGGYYDGLSGAVLRWDGGPDGQFAATGTPAPAYFRGTPAERGPDTAGNGAGAGGTGTSGEDAGQQLVLSLRTRHDADGDLVLGGALEDVWQHLAGSPPAGWGTAEPAGSRWSRQELTEFVRGRAPEPTWVVVVGEPDRPGIATLRVSRTTGGVEEDITVAFGHPPGGALPLDTLPALAERLVARHELVSLLVQRRPGRTDLTVPPRFEGPALPVAFALGRADVSTIGLTRARRPPLPDRPVQLGPAAAAGFYYPLGDGGWDALQELVGHLRPSSGRHGPRSAGAARPDGPPPQRAR
ncbi:DUF6177 family protein [Streptomyces sp. NPDC003077]|uniref:DUF6177 family protein n=1 Tax=Streptomyces sp. NPDC003077 TaxID=3154443 RepID=UPI00339FBFA7